MSGQRQAAASVGSAALRPGRAYFGMGVTFTRPASRLRQAHRLLPQTRESPDMLGNLKDALLGIGDLTVPRPPYVALFYENDEELREALGFVLVGLSDPSQAVVLFGAPKRLAEVGDLLNELAPEAVALAERDGRLVNAGGSLRARDILLTVEAQLQTLIAKGATVVRFLGFIAWGDTRWPSESELLRFEASVTKVTEKYPVIVLCTYQMSALPAGALVFGGIDTHPYTIVGTDLVENPHHVPFDRYVRRLDRGELPAISERMRDVIVRPLGSRQRTSDTA